MPKSKSRKKKTPKRVLALPDLEQTALWFRAPGTRDHAMLRGWRSRLSRSPKHPCGDARAS